MPLPLRGWGCLHGYASVSEQLRAGSWRRRASRLHFYRLARPMERPSNRPWQANQPGLTEPGQRPGCGTFPGPGNSDSTPSWTEITTVYSTHLSSANWKVWSARCRNSRSKTRGDWQRQSDSGLPASRDAWQDHAAAGRLRRAPPSRPVPEGAANTAARPNGRVATAFTSSTSSPPPGVGSMR